METGQLRWRRLVANDFNFNFTQDQLAEILPNNPYIAQWHDALYKILPEYEINTVNRVAAFVSQCAHESGSFAVLNENLNYRATSLRRVFGKYFSNDEIANQYANTPEMIANRVYSNRMGNGDEQSGDGWRYSGRGLIQLTGKDNYTKFAESIKTPVEDIPEYLVTFEGAVQGACWFWEANTLNQWADVGDVLTLTKRINGGTNGLDERIENYKHASQVLQG